MDKIDNKQNDEMSKTKINGKWTSVRIHRDAYVVLKTIKDKTNKSISDILCDLVKMYDEKLYSLSIPLIVVNKYNDFLKNVSFLIKDSTLKRLELLRPIIRTLADDAYSDFSDDMNQIIMDTINKLSVMKNQNNFFYKYKDYTPQTHEHVDNYKDKDEYSEYSDYIDNLTPEKEYTDILSRRSV